MKLKQLAIFSLLLIVLTNCADNSLKAKELELREREIALKEKELELQNPTSNKDVTADKMESNSAIKPVKRTPPASEEELQADLYAREASSPLNYLSAKYSYRTTLLGNTVIDGTIYNSAFTAGFKNVRMTVHFRSKTGLLLGERTFTVMEFVPASGSVSFNHKIGVWWDKVASSDCTIHSAEPY